MCSCPYPTDMTFAPLTFFIDTLTKAAPLSTGLRRVTAGVQQRLRSKAISTRNLLFYRVSGRSV